MVKQLVESAQNIKNGIYIQILYSKYSSNEIFWTAEYFLNQIL